MLLLEPIRQGGWSSGTASWSPVLRSWRSTERRALGTPRPLLSGREGSIGPLALLSGAERGRSGTNA
jgi:hypothetical protein